jgi:hypothetical protein
MLVLFESFTDPITTGREELGFSWVKSSPILDRRDSPWRSKLWAEMPDPKLENGNLVHTAVCLQEHAD